MEFHAFILCGQGHGLTPFSSVRSTGTSKALLPIANKPMLHHVIEFCNRAFFNKVTIVVDPSDESQIQKSVFSFNVDLLPLSCASSGELFFNIAKIVTSNYIILPCDFVTDLPPQVLIEAYRENPSLGLYISYKNTLSIEDKKNLIFPQNYTIYLEQDTSSILLDTYSHEDIAFYKSLPIRSKLSWSFPNSTVSKKLLNSSIFFGSPKIKDILIKEFTESYINSRTLSKLIRDLARRSWKHSTPKEFITLFEIPSQATFIRANNTATYLEANRYETRPENRDKLLKQKINNKPLSKSISKPQNSANIGIDSFIGENTIIGEKTMVKRTIIGENCIIGKRVKLTGSLLLNGVIIEDDVHLENCIIGNNSKIGTKSKLINSNVESTHHVQKSTITKSENLLCLSLEGLVNNDNQSDFESDESDSDSDTDSDDYENFDDVNNDDGLFDY